MSSCTFVVLIAVCGLSTVRCALTIEGVKCGQKTCKLLDYCSEIDRTCQPCSGICNTSTHNFDKELCEEACQVIMARIDNIQEIIRRRNPEGEVDHNLVRGIILGEIFQPIIGVNPRPIFDLEEIDASFAEVNFRFKKGDISRVVQALRLPHVIRTRSGHVASDNEGMCILLRRLAYPNRLRDLEYIFQRSAAALSEICSFVNMHIFDNFRHLLENLVNLNWLNQARLKQYAEAITAKGAAVENCWGFIDGTVRTICRPSIDQEEYYSGHKRVHCVKYQAVVCPDGITVSEIGAFPGRRHDAGMFRESGLYNQLEHNTRFPDGTSFVIFGDQAYGIRELLLCPFPGQGINEAQFQYFHVCCKTSSGMEFPKNYFRICFFGL